MEKNWDRAISHLLTWEGGFADRSDPKKYPHPEYVNFGITLSTYQHYHPGATKADIKNMTKEKAAAFYSQTAAREIDFNNLPAGLDLVALHCWTMFGPNMGTDEHPGLKWFRAKTKDDWAWMITKMMKNKMHRPEADHHYMPGWSDRFDSIHEVAKELSQ